MAKVTKRKVTKRNDVGGMIQVALLVSNNAGGKRVFLAPTRTGLSIETRKPISCSYYYVENGRIFDVAPLCEGNGGDIVTERTKTGGTINTVTIRNA
ncbi:MAG: hypothetical protein MSG64_06540 [Pyrinomonadaceae bacterium MAG19_C2-C3]|nr:hypothetical protein [Pyrinomonadaceae bacterium MAG19_C2-C3]